MESLAILVAIIFLIDIVAGPIAIALTLPKLVNAISSQSKGVSVVLTVIRRLVHGLLVTIGFFIGSWLVNIAETPAKLLGIFSIVTSYIAVRREYFPDFYLLANSNTIHSLTSYPHGSGFSYWCAKTFNIPYVCKYIQ